MLTCDFNKPNFTIKFLWFIPFGLVNNLICYFGNLPDIKRYWRDNVIFTFLGEYKVRISLEFEKLTISVYITETTKKEDKTFGIKEVEQFIFYQILNLYWNLFDNNFVKLEKEDSKDTKTYYAELKEIICDFLENIKQIIDEKKPDNSISEEITKQNDKLIELNAKIKKLEDKLGITDKNNLAILIKQRDELVKEIEFSKNQPKTDNNLSTIVMDKDNLKNLLKLFPDDMYLSVDNENFVKYEELKELKTNKTNIKCFKFNSNKNDENMFDFENPEYKPTAIFKNYTFNPNLTSKPKIFISYSHIDTEYRNEFVKHLTPLRDAGILDFYTDNIKVGAGWDNEMKDELKTSNIVCYLISSDFMSSGYIKNVEANIYNVKGKTLIPIVIRECDYEYWNNQLLYKVQGANHNKILTLHDNYTYPYDKKERSKNERDAFWTNVIKQVKELPEVKQAINQLK